MVEERKRCVFSAVIFLVTGIVHAENVSDLSEMSLEQLMNVNIIGASKYEQKQSQVAAAVSVINRAEIKAFGWRTLNDVLASLPGVYSTYDRQYHYLGTRGFSLPGDFNTRILLTINGNRVNDVVFDQAYNGRDFPLDLDLIDRIEFLPGPGGAVYGQNALFGVVNIVTRKGESVDGFELAAAYHDPQTGAEGRGTWGKKLANGTDVLLSASGYHAEGEDRFYRYPGAGENGATVSGLAAGLDGERDHEFFASLAHGSWSFDLSYGDRRKDDPLASYLGDPLVPGQYQHDRQLLTQLQYQDDFADNTLHVMGRFFLGQQRYSGPGSFEGLHSAQFGKSDWQGGEIRLLSTAYDRHKLMFGVEYQDNSRQDQANINYTFPNRSVLIPKKGWRIGIYAQEEWAISDTFSATFGLRYDNNPAIGEKLSPRAALIWQATANTTLKALYGRAYRAPNVYERDFAYESQIPNPALKGESIDTVELVWDQRWFHDLNLRASLYHWAMQNLVDLGIDQASKLSQYQNGEAISAYGVELSADKTWEWGGRLRGSVSYQHPGYQSGADLPNSPQWLSKLNFSSPVFTQDYRVGYELQYSSERQAVNGSTVDGYVISSLTLQAEWLKGLDVSLSIYNLFDAQYAQPGSDMNWQTALDQDGRQFRLKVMYGF